MSTFTAPHYRQRRHAIGIALTALTLAGAPAAANAATVHISDDGPVYVVANATETNTLKIEGALVPEAEGSVVVTESGSAPLTAGTGCTQTAAAKVTCRALPRVHLWLWGGDDVVDVQLIATSAFVPELVANLGSGNDTLVSRASEGSTDDVAGGTGNDRLITGDRRDSVWGEGGNDRIETGASPDWVYGGDGNDQIDGGLGNDNLRGENDNDVIGPLLAQPQTFCTSPSLGQPYGTCSTRYFRSSPAPDGADVITGDDGDDLLSSVDGQQDYLVRCGAGTDTVEFDSIDQIETAPCETRRRVS